MPASTPVRILIVDDVPSNLLALEAVLGREDHVLVRAESGAEAVRLVETSEPFATILLDVQMPGMDGYATARRIKALKQGRDVPIIFVTAVYNEHEDVRKGYEAGALDYFAKPLDPELLRTKVQIYADLFRMTRQTKPHDSLLDAIRARETAERALDTVLQSVSEGLIIMDADGTIIRANEEAKWIWGSSQTRPLRSKEDFVGWWVETGKSVQPSEWAMARALKSGKPCMNEPIAIQCFDGKSRTILESSSVLLDQRGKAVGAVIVTKIIAAKVLPSIMGDRHPDPAAYQRPDTGQH